MKFATRKVNAIAGCLTAAVLSTGVAGCAETDAPPPAGKHEVYFVGYLYDGASGLRLKREQVTALSLKYRDKVIRTLVEEDGRYVTLDPLPTWQDYAVYVGAPGYRPFVSRNVGIDVPKSLAMTDGLGTTSTTQTFQYDATLFPAALKSPKIVITVEKADAQLAAMPLPRASGTIRLRPETTSVLERPGFVDGTVGGTVGTSQAPGRRWVNDEDLLNQTVIKPFAEGKVELAEGELSYGVLYQIAIFDVKGYQPVLMSGQQGLLAGAVTSRSVSLPTELREPLRILSTTTETCVPPAPTSTEYGAVVKVTFNQPAEFVGTTFAEDVDNGVQIGTAQGTSGFYCPLKMSVSSTLQERGTMVTLEDNVLTLSFNPSIGVATVTQFGTTCMVPPALTLVSYGNLALLTLRPKDDPSRKRSMDVMLQELGAGMGGLSTQALTCPGRARAF